MNPMDPAELSPREIAHRLIGQIESEGVRLVAIDTLNGYLHSVAQEPLTPLHLRELLAFLANRGMVTPLILTRHRILSAEAGPPIDVSFLADNVFSLQYFEIDGSIRPSVAMVKKRAGAHGRARRELLLTAEGPKPGNPIHGARVHEETPRAQPSAQPR